MVSRDAILGSNQPFASGGKTCRTCGSLAKRSFICVLRRRREVSLEVQAEGLLEVLSPVLFGMFLE
jgi:hypothetical protein